MFQCFCLLFIGNRKTDSSRITSCLIGKNYPKLLTNFTIYNYFYLVGKNADSLIHLVDPTPTLWCFQTCSTPTLRPCSQPTNSSHARGIMLCTVEPTVMFYSWFVVESGLSSLSSSLSSSSSYSMSNNDDFASILSLVPVLFPSLSIVSSCSACGGSVGPPSSTACCWRSRS